MAVRCPLSVKRSVISCYFVDKQDRPQGEHKNEQDCSLDSSFPLSLFPFFFFSFSFFPLFSLFSLKD